MAKAAAVVGAFVAAGWDAGCVVVAVGMMKRQQWEVLQRRQEETLNWDCWRMRDCLREPRMDSLQIAAVADVVELVIETEAEAAVEELHMASAALWMDERNYSSN